MVDDHTEMDVQNTLMCLIRDKDNEDGHQTAVLISFIALRLEETRVNQAFQTCQRNPLHADGAPKWCKADVTEA